MRTARYTITAVEPLGGHVLFIRFADGREGAVDLATEVQRLSTSEVFAPLASPDFFAQAFIGDFGELAWPNGADWAPDALHDRVAASVEAG